jgi:hypothetical protein
MGLEKINLDMEIDSTNLKFSFENFKYFYRLFFAWFFHLKCYGISMCGDKKIMV